MMHALMFGILFSHTVTVDAPDQAARTDSLMRSLYPDGLPGAVIGVVRDGATVFTRGYGIADLSTREAVRTSTNFNICSLTKQFTAYAVLQLARDGRLALDDTLTRFFPAFTPHIAGRVTVRHLLTHASGIREHYSYVDRSLYTTFEDRDVLTVLSGVDTLNFAPGSQYRYSNAAYCLLSLIIEKASGQPYPAYMERSVLAPAGMLRSVVIRPDRPIEERATGYEVGNDTIRKADAQESLFFSTMGDGGLYTSMNDYLRWIGAIQNGTALDPALVAAALSPVHPIDSSRHLSYGYGWFVAGTGNARVVYHTGSNGGFRTIVFTKPSDRYALVIFSNRTGIDLEDLIRTINSIWNVDDSAFVKLETLID